VLGIRRGIHTLTVGLLILSACLAACTASAGPNSGSAGLQGTITVSGAFALYPMMVRWGEAFHALHPGVTFDISAGGAGKGMADALNGAVDIGMVSRPIFDAEIEKGAFWVAVAKDGVVATVNGDNPVLEPLLEGGITQDAAEGIWITGEVVTWGQAVGGRGGEEIHVYTRADACGAAQTWAQYLGDYAQEDLQGIAVQADPGVAEAVTQDVLALGYNNLNFAYDADTGLPLTGLQVVPLDLDQDGRIGDEERFYDTKGDLVQAIADGRYPSPPSRALNLVTKGQPEGPVKAFLTWVMTDGQQYLEEVGYVHLSPSELQEGLTKLE